MHQHVGNWPGKTVESDRVGDRKFRIRSVGLCGDKWYKSTGKIKTGFRNSDEIYFILLTKTPA
ncbi:MAG: hypothetical protein K1W10_07165 [Lachnospiraceae bacterium]